MLLLTGAGAAGLSYIWFRAPTLTNDSYQYLDAAGSVRAGGCICVGMAHFDEQLAFGRLPVPLTHYAPGYPILIAALSRTGIRPETAGYLLSVAGYLLTIWLIWDVSLMLGSSPPFAFLFAFVWLANRVALTYAATVLTEMVFTATVMMLIALLIRDIKTNGKSPALLSAIGALAGAAYFFRYAGLFLIPPAILYLGWRVWRNRQTLRWALGGVLGTCLFVVPVQVRNVLTTGSWQGMYLSKEPYRLAGAIPRSVLAAYHLVLGDLMFVPYPVWCVFLLVLAAGAGFITFKDTRRVQTGATNLLPAALFWIATFLSVYVMGTVVSMASLTNMDLELSTAVRYMIPVYPAILALVAATLSRIPTQGIRFAAAFLAVEVLILNGLNLAQRPGPMLHSVVASALDSKQPDGKSVRQWLNDLPAGTVLVSEEGLSLRYLTRRPVIALMEPPENSNRPMDSVGFRALMTHYRSRYLLLFPIVRPRKASLPFLREVVDGKGPAWLKRRSGNAYVAVYQCDECAQ